MKRALIVSLFLLAACGPQTMDLGNRPAGGGGGSAGGGGGSGSGGGSGGGAAGGGGGQGGGGSSFDGGPTGLPCDVEALLAGRCRSCHGNPPTQAAPVSLVTRADLLAPSKSNPSLSNAQVSLGRMQSAPAPMPPAPEARATAAEIAVMQGWISAGTPPGNCNAPDAGAPDGGTAADAGDPYNTPTVCTSNTYWTNGDTGAATMHPGKACRSCHVVGGKASTKGFDISGTVYASAHEPDDCNGLAGVTVVITDAQGVDHSLAVNAAGNFYHQDYFGLVAFSTPYRARVVRNGKTRVMAAAQTVGDCNSCHTEKGASNAPGRIMAP